LVNRVFVSRTSNFSELGVRQAVFKALDSLDFQPKKAPENIVVKINLCYYWDHSTGQTTHPHVASAVIDYIRERWNEKAAIHLVESDATAVRMKYAFRMLGYEELAAKKVVHLSNLSEEPSHEATVRVNGRTYKFCVPNLISDADVFISVPKLKTHSEAIITCALKNQFGCNPVWKKIPLHIRLDEAICALNKIMRPDVVLVDGIIAFGGYPKKMGVIIGGTDPVAVDSVAARIMGYDPLKIGHVELAVKEGIGRLVDIVVEGENIDEIAKVFPKQESTSKLPLILTFPRDMFHKYFTTLT
jgi:uncharacterized protein (DUF362 family)